MDKGLKINNESKSRDLSVMRRGLSVRKTEKILALESSVDVASSGWCGAAMTVLLTRLDVALTLLLTVR